MNNMKAPKNANALNNDLRTGAGGSDNYTNAATVGVYNSDNYTNAATVGWPYKVRIGLPANFIKGPRHRSEWDRPGPLTNRNSTSL